MLSRLLYDADALYDDHIEALSKGVRCKDGSMDFSLVTDGLRAEREQGITRKRRLKPVEGRECKFLI